MLIIKDRENIESRLKTVIADLWKHGRTFQKDGITYKVNVPNLCIISDVELDTQKLHSMENLPYNNLTINSAFTSLITPKEVVRDISILKYDSIDRTIAPAVRNSSVAYFCGIFVDPDNLTKHADGEITWEFGESSFKIMEQITKVRCWYNRSIPVSAYNLARVNSCTIVEQQRSIVKQIDFATLKADIELKNVLKKSEKTGREYYTCKCNEYLFGDVYYHNNYLTCPMCLHFRKVKIETLLRTTLPTTEENVLEEYDDLDREVIADMKSGMRPLYGNCFIGKNFIYVTSDVSMQTIKFTKTFLKEEFAGKRIIKLHANN